MDTEAIKTTVQTALRQAAGQDEATQRQIWDTMMQTLVGDDWASMQAPDKAEAAATVKLPFDTFRHQAGKVASAATEVEK